MAAQQARLDALSNDVANVDTVGYKRMRVAFRDLVYTGAGKGSGSGVMEGAGAAATTVGRGDTGASLQNTGEPLNIAISGSAYLSVRRGDGSKALTRDGTLSIGTDGALRAGGNLLDPPVTVPRNTDPKDLTIGGDGSVTVSDKPVGRLSIVGVRSPDGLNPVGDNLFVTTAASGAATRVVQPAVQQGVLESSDVDMADVMTDMMDAQRSYSMASKAISMQDQMMQIANGIKK